MASSDEYYAYGAYSHENMVEDGDFPRQTSLEDYVKYKPARRKKGESPKRDQLPPALPFALNVTSKANTNPDKDQPLLPRTPAVHSLAGGASLTSSHGGSTTDTSRGPSAFRFQELTNGKFMAFKLPAEGNIWQNLGVVDRRSYDAFQHFQQHWQEYPDYQLPSGEYNEDKFRSHMELSVRKIARSIETDTQGNHGVVPRPASTMLTSAPQGSETPLGNESIHAGHGNSVGSYSGYMSARTPTNKPFLGPHQTHLLQSYNGPQMLPGHEPRNLSPQNQRRGATNHTDPFVSPKTPKDNDTPSGRFMKQHQQFREQEYERYGTPGQPLHLREHALHRSHISRENAMGHPTYSSPMSYHGSAVRNSVSAATPTRLDPEREEIRRTVLHDPCLSIQGGSQKPDQTTTTPASQSVTALADIPSLWPNPGAPKLRDIPLPRPVAGTNNPLPPPSHTTNPWGVKSHKPGRTPMTATFLDTSLKSPDVDASSPHLPDDVLRDFYAPVDFAASPLTGKDALRPNVGRVPVVVKPLTDGRPTSSCTQQSAYEHAKEAAAQKEQDYAAGLEAMWTSGIRHLPESQNRVVHAVAKYNSSLATSASTTGKVEVHDEMVLWDMLYTQMKDHMGRAMHIGGASPKWLPKGSPEASQSGDVYTHVGEQGPYQGNSSLSSHDRMMRVGQGQARGDHWEVLGNGTDQWAIKGRPRVVLPDYAKTVCTT